MPHISCQVNSGMELQQQFHQVGSIIYCWHTIKGDYHPVHKHHHR